LIQLLITIQFSTSVDEPVKFAVVCCRTEAWPCRTVKWEQLNAGISLKSLKIVLEAILLQTQNRKSITLHRFMADDMTQYT